MMMSLWSNAMGSAGGDGGGGGGGGGVCFNSTIQVVNADNTISIRHMNPHGGYYDTEIVETYDEDGSLSFHLDSSQTDEDGMSFLDAVQDLVVSADSSASCPTTTTSNNEGYNDDDDHNDDDGPVNDYFQSSGYEPKTCRCARARRQLRVRC
jgi:hypothetical protein